MDSLFEIIWLDVNPLKMLNYTDNKGTKQRISTYTN